MHGKYQFYSPLKESNNLRTLGSIFIQHLVATSVRGAFRIAVIFTIHLTKIRPPAPLAIGLCVTPIVLGVTVAFPGVPARFLQTQKGFWLLGGCCC